MRILTGKFKGTPIAPRPVRPLRPTPDKVRQAMMNVLGEAVAGGRGLDLFSGTGALGLEALSRGAAHVIFVEEKRGLTRGIAKVLDRLGIPNQAEIRCSEVLPELKRFSQNHTRFDFILADPPYDKGWGPRMVHEVGALALLAPHGWLVVETSKRDSMPESSGPLTRSSQKAYGDTIVHYYKHHSAL